MDQEKLQLLYRIEAILRRNSDKESADTALEVGAWLYEVDPEERWKGAL
jgi:hypothetical protein